MRTHISTALIMTTVALTGATFMGCGSSSSRKGSTSAATTSGSTTATTSSSSTTGGNGSGVVTNPPPVVTLRTDAMVSSWDLKEVIHVDAKTGVVANRYATGDGPTDVINTNTETFVANALSQDITHIDRLAGNVAGSIDPTGVPITGISLLNFLDNILKPMVRPTGLAMTPNGRKIYSANLLNVTAIDGTTRVPTKSILGLSPISLTNLIANPGQTLSNFMASPIQGLGFAKVAANNDYAVVTSMITGKLLRIDATTDRVIDYVDVGRGPIGVAIARNKAYVANALSNDISVVDLTTGTVLTTIAGGLIPVDVAVSGSEDRIYVANAVSGDISVIDTAVDLIVDTLPAGMSITSIFQQLGITLPTGTSGGMGGLLNGFLQGFTGGMTNPGSFGNLITGGGGGLLSPGNLINGLLTGFLAYAGINQQQFANLNLPALGIMSLSVAHDPDFICAGNAFMGELAVTEASTRTVSPISGLTGLGPVDVRTIRPL